MSNPHHSFKEFEEACKTNFESMVEGPVIIISHTFSDHEPHNTYISTYQYNIATSDGGQRGPYKFECRQIEGERMFIYSEI